MTHPTPLLGAVVVRVPEEAELLAVARMACAAHLHLITDGRETLLSPYVPPGWWKLAVTVKERPSEGPRAEAA